MGTTQPTQCSESTHAHFPQLSAEPCVCKRSRTVCQKVPRPTFRNIPSSCCMFLQQRTQRFPLSAGPSAGLSAGLSTQSLCWTFRRVSALMRAEHSIAARIHDNPVPLAGPQGRIVLRGPSTLGWRMQKRYWYKKPLVDRCSQTERQKTFRLVSTGAAPLPGGPPSLAPSELFGRSFQSHGKNEIGLGKCFYVSKFCLGGHECWTQLFQNMAVLHERASIWMGFRKEASWTNNSWESATKHCGATA